MFTLLAKLSAELTAAVDTVTWAIQSALFINHLAVDFVARCCQASLDALLLSACQLRCVFLYGLQDFFSFATDVSSMVCFIVLVTGQGFMHVCGAVHSAWALAIDCVTGVFAGLLWAVRGIGLAVEAINCAIFSSVALVWSAVTLIGHSAIYVLCAIPRTLLLSVVHLFNNLSVGLQTVGDIFINTYHIGLQSTVSIAGWTVATVAAIPVDAYYGFALYCLFHLSFKYLLRSQRFRRSSVLILRTVKHMLGALRPATWVWLPISRWFVRQNRIDLHEGFNVNPDADDTVANPYLLARRALYEDRRLIPEPEGTMARSDSPQPSCAQLEAPQPRSEILDEMFQLKRQLTLEKENRLCIVCQDRDKCVLIMPCRHLCLCQECSEGIHDTCPMCRNLIREQMLVFS